MTPQHGIDKLKMESRWRDNSPRRLLSAVILLFGVNCLVHGLVISELMYHPAGTDPVENETGEFIELYNNGPVQISLQGFAFDRGITYLFPTNTMLKAAAYLVLAKSPVTIQSSSGLTNVLGPYEGALSNGGEELRLVDSTGMPVIDFTYGIRGDWPAAADGAGHSVVLARADADPDQACNWKASRLIGGSPGAVDDRAGGGPRTLDLVREGDVGHYYKGVREPANGATAWTEIGFLLDANWLTGTNGFGYTNETDERQHLNTLLNDMTGNYLTLYARLTFNVNAADLRNLSQLSATVAYDDGFVLYLNGVRVAALNVNGNPPAFNAPATSSTDYMPQVIDLTSHTNLLRAGLNVLAIQGHNGLLSGSSDFVIAPQLQATIVPPPPEDDPARRIVINEIFAASGAGSDWIELYNPTEQSIVLGGAWLSDDADRLDRFRLPQGTMVPPKDFLVLDQTQFGFGLSTGGEAVFLTAPSREYVLAAYAFGVQQQEFSIGRYPDGGLSCYLMNQPSRGAANVRQRTQTVVINEIMYHAPDGPQDEYLELRNIGQTDANISGWKFLGISYRFPEKTTLPAGGYLVVCDDLVAAARTYQLPPDALFGNYSGSLENAGETIALLTGDDLVVDLVAYDDAPPWPLSADGLGASLERSCISEAWENPNDWRASPLGIPSPLAPNAVNHCSPPQPSNVVINEIMYNPFNDQDDERRTEYIELFNKSTNTADLSGWMIAGDVMFRFAPGARLAPRDYLVVAWDAPRLVQFYGLDSGRVTGPFRRDLPNGGGRIVLLGTDGRAVDAVEYDDDFPWPSGADGYGRKHGSGRSLERQNPNAPAEDLANWDASPEDQPTPGAPNTHFAQPLPPQVIGLEVTPQPVTSLTSPVVQAKLAHGEVVAAAAIEFWVDDPEITVESHTTLPMLDNGAKGDQLAGDGIWSATLPAYRNNSIVRYRVLCDTGSGPAVVSPRPNSDVYSWHAYYVDPGVTSALPVYHLFLSASNWALLHTWTAPGRVSGNQPNPNWDREVPAVFVANGRVFDVAVRHQGSRWGRNGGSTISFGCPSHRTDGQAQVRSWRIQFPSYRNHNGIDVLILQKRSGWPQLISFKMFELAGIPAPLTSWAALRINGCDYNGAAFEIERPGRDMVARWFDEVGDLFKSEGYTGDEGPWSWGDERLIIGSLNGFTEQQRYEFTYERATHNWENHPLDGKEDLVEPLIERLHAARARGPAALRAFLSENFDVERTLRYICTINYVGTFDDMFQNHFLYRKAEDGKWCVFPWDMDNTLGGSFGEWNANPFRGADESRLGSVGNRQGWWNRLKDSFFIAYEKEFRSLFYYLNNHVYPPAVMNRVIDQAAAYRGLDNSTRLSLQSHIQRRYDYLNSVLQPPSLDPRLYLAKSGQSLILTWDLGLWGFAVQSSDAIDGKWTALKAPVFINGNYHSLTVPASQGQRFYRLVQE